MKKLPIFAIKWQEVLYLIVFCFCIISPLPVSGYITVEDKGTNYIYWSWNNTGVDSISVDGKTVTGYDLSNSYVLSEINANSLHQIKLFNTTEGLLESNTTNSLPMTETAQEGFFSLANLYLLFIIGIIVLIAGVIVDIPIIGFGGSIIGLIGLTASFNNSFGLGLLFFILVIAGIIEGVSSLLS